MPGRSLLDEIAAKGSDKAAIADRVASSPAAVSVLLDGMRATRAAVKFGCGRVLMLVSARQPEIVYPFFERIAEFLDSDNKILKWGAIATLSNLARVDAACRFKALLRRYCAIIAGADMVSACNVIKGCIAIARAHPDLAERIKDAILKVEKATYKTPECRNVAIGHAIDALGAFYDLIDDKGSVIRFAKRQLRNRRKKVAAGARRFLKCVGVAAGPAPMGD